MMNAAEREQAVWLAAFGSAIAYEGVRGARLKLEDVDKAAERFKNQRDRAEVIARHAVAQYKALRGERSNE
jgi:hypothetical protein